VSGRVVWIETPIGMPPFCMLHALLHTFRRKAILRFWHRTVCNVSGSEEKGRGTATAQKTGKSEVSNVGKNA